jgi:hypothetical protein
VDEPSGRLRFSPARALLAGTLAVGVLDLLDAFIFFGLRGAQPIRICQSIAAGLLGRAAFSGGWRTAALGVGLHFFIAFCIVLAFFLAARRLRFLSTHWLLSGIVYGVAVYLVMNFIVVPLSAAGSGGPRAWPVVINGVLIHMFGVGVPASWASRRIGD